jgi:hypothetical protein
MEVKVFTQFSEASKKDCSRWVLDTGATNHMTGSKSAFSELDRSIHGTVKFGDGSVVQIEGVDTILFSCKTREHHLFADVYYIPKLDTNIINLRQLDEVGYHIIIDGGALRIRDGDRRLLAKVFRSPNRLYVIMVEVVQPVCLLARGPRVPGCGMPGLAT